MGYYTRFTLEIYNSDNYSEGSLSLSKEESYKIAKSLCSISDWFNIEDLDSNSDYPLDNLISSDIHKWYNYHDEMIELSKLYPSYIFELYGKGEDFEDLWCGYYWAGKGRCVNAEISYPVPSWLAEKM